MINSVTHVLMYSHYLWTSFGRKNPFKAHLTKWQIAQFYSCFVHAVLVVDGRLDRRDAAQARAGLAPVLLPHHDGRLFTFKMAWIPEDGHRTSDVRPGQQREQTTHSPSSPYASSPPGVGPMAHTKGDDIVVVVGVAARQAAPRPSSAPLGWW